MSGLSCSSREIARLRGIAPNRSVLRTGLLREIHPTTLFLTQTALFRRIACRWRNAVGRLTRTEYMSLPYEVKKRLLLAEFETGRELIKDIKLMVARH